MTRSPGVLFDATGTLIETAAPVGEVYRRVALEFEIDLPAWRLDDAFRRVLQHAPERGLEGSTEAERRAADFDWWAERIRHTFQATDSTVRFADPGAFARALFDAYRAPDAWRLRSGIRALLDRLLSREVPMGVVSNFDHRLPEILEALDLNQFFISIEVPSHCGVTKPGAGIFEAAAATLDRTLSELVYVGDDAPTVLDAIRRLGLRVEVVDEETDWSDPRDPWLRIGEASDAATLPPGNAAATTALQPLPPDQKGSRNS